MNSLETFNPVGQPAHEFSTRLGQLAARVAPTLRVKAMPAPFCDALNHANRSATPGQEAMDKLKANLMVKDASL